MTCVRSACHLMHLARAEQPPSNAECLATHVQCRLERHMHPRSLPSDATSRCSLHIYNMAIYMIMTIYTITIYSEASGHCEAAPPACYCPPAIAEQSLYVGQSLAVLGVNSGCACVGVALTGHDCTQTCNLISISIVIPSSRCSNLANGSLG